MAFGTPAIDGFGLGLRSSHYRALLEGEPAVDWLEVLTENYLVDGGRPLYWLDRICERYPVVLHGVSLSIGGTDPLDRGYLEAVAALVRRTEAAWVSDHLCWTGFGGSNLHDLMPLPFTEEALHHIAARVGEVQDRLGRRILLENVSSYLEAGDNTLSEWEFLTELAERADCLLLLDINNIHVNAHNHGFDPLDYLSAIPVERVAQFHIAGHSHQGELLIDTHDQPVCEASWRLYRAACKRFGPVPTMIERDDNIPDLAVLLAELDRARLTAAEERKAA